MTMTPTQREAALRLVDIALKHSADSDSDISEETALLRELAAEPVRECADNDSPWLICKPCAAVGRCAKLPVAWRSKERINGEFDSGWKLTSNEPPQTPRTIAIEPLYIHPPQQRKPLTERQIVSALADAGCCGTVKLTYDSGPYEVTCATAAAIDLVRAIERAHGIVEAP